MGIPKKESKKTSLRIGENPRSRCSMSQNVRHLSSKELICQRTNIRDASEFAGAMLLGANKALAGKRKLSGTFREHETHMEPVRWCILGSQRNHVRRYAE